MNPYQSINRDHLMKQYLGLSNTDERRAFVIKNQLVDDSSHDSSLLTINRFFHVLNQKYPELTVEKLKSDGHYNTVVDALQTLIIDGAVPIINLRGVNEVLQQNVLKYYAIYIGSEGGSENAHLQINKWVSFWSRVKFSNRLNELQYAELKILLVELNIYTFVAMMPKYNKRQIFAELIRNSDARSLAVFFKAEAKLMAMLTVKFGSRYRTSIFKVESTDECERIYNALLHYKVDISQDLLDAIQSIPGFVEFGNQILQKFEEKRRGSSNSAAVSVSTSSIQSGVNGLAPKSKEGLTLTAEKKPEEKEDQNPVMHSLTALAPKRAVSSVKKSPQMLEATSEQKTAQIQTEKQNETVVLKQHTIQEKMPQPNKDVKLEEKPVEKLADKQAQKPIKSPSVNSKSILFKNSLPNPENHPVFDGLREKFKKQYLTDIAKIQSPLTAINQKIIEGKQTDIPALTEIDASTLTCAAIVGNYNLLGTLLSLYPRIPCKQQTIIAAVLSQDLKTVALVAPYLQECPSAQLLQLLSLSSQAVRGLMMPRVENGQAMQAALESLHAILDDVKHSQKYTVKSP